MQVKRETVTKMVKMGRKMVKGKNKITNRKPEIRFRKLKTHNCSTISPTTWAVKSSTMSTVTLNYCYKSKKRNKLWSLFKSSTWTLTRAISLISLTFQPSLRHSESIVTRSLLIWNRPPVASGSSLSSHMSLPTSISTIWTLSREQYATFMRARTHR